MSPDRQYRAGMSAYTAGELDSAVEYLTPVVDGGGAAGLVSRFYVGQAHYRLALDLLHDRQYRTAGYHFQAAARHHPEGGGLARFLVACHLGSGRMDRAVHELEKCLRECPGDSTARIRLALAQFKCGAPAAAADTLRDGIRRRPDDAELHYQLGVILAAADNTPQAERLFQRAVILDPGHARAWERLAQCCGLRARHNEALRCLTRARQLDPANRRVAWQFNLLAQTLERDRPQGRPERIERTRQWSESSASSAPLRQLPQPAGREDSRAEAAALDRLSEAVLAEPDFVSALLGLPESEVDREVFSTLAATLERALQKHPEYADLHYHCGCVYRRLGRNQDAIVHAEQAVGINRRYVSALILLAQLYAQTERCGDGIARLEEAIASGGDYPDVHYLVGRLSQISGQMGQARRAFQRALELNGRYEAAKEALVALGA